MEKASPAEKAGIEPGDVIVQFDGTAISRPGELSPLVSDASPGTRVEVRVWRRGKVKDTATAQPTATDGDKGQLGLAVRPLTPAERDEAKAASGLVVDSVSVGPAEKAGTRPSDVFLSVDGEMLSDVEKLRAQVAKSGKYALRVPRCLYPLVLGRLSAAPVNVERQIMNFGVHSKNLKTVPTAPPAWQARATPTIPDQR